MRRDGRQHNRRGAGRQQIHLIGDEFLGDVARRTNVALRFLVFKRQILARLEAGGLERIDKALARRVERRVIDNL